MPVLLAALLGGLVNIAGTLAGRVLVAVGISALTYTGLSQSLDWLQSQALSSISGLPASVLGMMALMKIGQSLSVIFSAYAVRMTLEGLSAGGSITRWVKT